MKRWRGSTSWTLVWGFLLLVGGMIFYTSYLGPIYLSSREKTSLITNETKAVLARNEHDPEAGGTASTMQNQTGEETADDQLSLSNNAKRDQAIPRKQNLTDFPCPVNGSILRGVGNYYSEAFDSYFFHAGIDYAEAEGTMIRATHGGKVIFSGADPILGQKVTLDCGGGWLVTYGGLVNLQVQIGEIVETQDTLGQVGLFAVGETESDQPQVHYEVWHGDEMQKLAP